MSVGSVTPSTPCAGPSHAQILRSTAVIGGSSLVNIALAVVRGKAMAILLGPGGVGLMGLYNSIVDLAQTLTGLGVQSSAVRQVAEAAGTGDVGRIARAATVVRWLSGGLGLAGALLLAALCVPVATFTFGDHAHAAGIALLAASVFFRLVSAGQIALLQGLRRIGELASINMLAAFLSTVVGIPLVYFFGTSGIVPSIVAMAVVSFGASWWFARKLDIESRAAPTPQFRNEATAILRLGLVFMASGLLTVGAAYTVRLIVLKQGGIEAAGLYQSAWALGGIYAGFILQAMGTDFYPRLTAAAGDDAACNRMVNEQAQVSILLAGPGLLATLTVAPLVVTLFYSADFQPAVGLLRWICLGMILRIVAWPMGFIVLAKGAQRIFFWTEVAATLVHIGVAWILVPQVGLVGAGVAFFTLYVWHSLLIYSIVRRLSGFRWSRANKKLGLIFLTTTGLVFCAFLVLPEMHAAMLGAAAATVASLYSLRSLLQFLPKAAFPIAPGVRLLKRGWLRPLSGADWLSFKRTKLQRRPQRKGKS